LKEKLPQNAEKGLYEIENAQTSLAEKYFWKGKEIFRFFQKAGGRWGVNAMA